MAKARCRVRWYVQKRGAKMLTPLKTKTQAKKLAGAQAVNTAHSAACSRGMGVKKCKRGGACAKVFAYKQ